MAEVTAFRNNALPYEVYGAPWTVVFPLFDEAGRPVTGATCDSEVSKNGDTAVDCTNEGVEIPFTTATNKGMYYLILTAAEMAADIVTVTIYSATSKATCIVLYPRKLVTLASGTSQGGAAGYITLAASTVDFDGQFNGCLCVATIDGNVEARILQACTAADQQCTVTPSWNVTPDADDTYVIYLPEGVQIPQANIKAVGDNTTNATNLASACSNYSATRGLTGTAVPAVAAEAVGGMFTRGSGTGQINQAVNGTVDVNIEAIDATTGYATDLAEICKYLFANTCTLTAVIADGSVIAQMLAIGGDISDYSPTTHSQEYIGDALPNAVPGAAGGLFIAGANAATSVTTAFTANIIGDITGNLSGSVGSVTGAVGSVAGNVDGNVTGSVGSLVGHTVQSGDNYPIVSHADYGNANLARTGADGDTLKALSDEIAAVATTIGAAGASLTALPWNAAWDAEVQSECADALAAWGKTGFSLTSTGLDAVTTWTVDVTGTVSGNSTHAAADVVTALGAGSTLTDCLTATGFNTTVPDTAGTAAALHATTDAKVDAVKVDTAAILLDTGTAGVIVATNNDKTGYALTAAGNNAVADATLLRDIGDIEGSITSIDCLAGLVCTALHANTEDNAGNLTVYATDNATELAQVPITNDAAAQPMTGAAAT